MRVLTRICSDRINQRGATWGLALGFALGLLKLTCQAFFGAGKIEDPGWLAAIGDFNFLYFSGVLFLAVVFVVIGIFAAKAAVEYDASEARGFAGALESLQQQPYGPWLLGIVAAGLVSYGVYALVRARYRVVRTR